MSNILCIDCNNNIDNIQNKNKFKDQYRFNRISGSYKVSIPISNISSFPCVLCNSCTKKYNVLNGIKCNICKLDYILITGSTLGWRCAALYNKNILRGGYGSDYDMCSYKWVEPIDDCTKCNTICDFCIRYFIKKNKLKLIN